MYCDGVQGVIPLERELIFVDAVLGLKHDFLLCGLILALDKEGFWWPLLLLRQEGPSIWARCGSI